MVTTSKLCTFSDYEHPGYRDAIMDLKEGFILHRKQWEFAMILRTFKERGVLRSGSSGLGFAVGTEPLPAAFCARGASVLATDQAPSDEAIESWGQGQLCFDLDKLNDRSICGKEEFTSLCRFRHVDMNDMQSDLGLFDFLWSSCSFEHLGSLDKGLEFVVKSTRYLKPGGFAAHTTEFNLSSNEKTISTGGSVYYRQCDIEKLGSMLKGVGCELEPVDYSRGDHPVDKLVDVDRKIGPPHCHLKLQIDEYTLTSILLVIRKS